MACWGPAEVDELEKIKRRISSAEEGEAERGVEGGCGSSCEELVNNSGIGGNKEGTQQEEHVWGAVGSGMEALRVSGRPFQAECLRVTGSLGPEHGREFSFSFVPGHSQGHAYFLIERMSELALFSQHFVSKY